LAESFRLLPWYVKSHYKVSVCLGLKLKNRCTEEGSLGKVEDLYSSRGDLCEGDVFREGKKRKRTAMRNERMLERIQKEKSKDEK